MPFPQPCNLLFIGRVGILRVVGIFDPGRFEDFRNIQEIRMPDDPFECLKAQRAKTQVFVAVFVGNDGHSAFEFLKTVRQAVEDLHIRHNSPVCEWVTISVGGVTLLPKMGDVYDDYLKIADNMLYKAKHNGRNMVVWSDGGKEPWRER